MRELNLIYLVIFLGLIISKFPHYIIIILLPSYLVCDWSLAVAAAPRNSTLVKIIGHSD